LYVCTGDRPDLEAFLDGVLAAGVDVVQLREKAMEAAGLLRVARRFRVAADRHGALFVVNDRVDVALAADADGVHLGQDDIPPGPARGIAGPHLLIGRSTHATAEIRAANDEPVDYIAVGPVHETPTKPGRRAVGPALLEAAARESRHAWFAIGGMNAATLPAAVAAGATRAVVVRAVTEAGDPAAAASELRRVLDGVR
jgi:thiamine-phosphate pyrophosphorylase